MLDPNRGGWIGVDLDGTLAIDHWKGSYTGEIGEPVPVMVERVKKWIAEGFEVKIFTARVSRQNRDGAAKTELAKYLVEEKIAAWCEQHIGKRLDITCEKDYNMVELWDDRAVQVVKNTGERVGNINRN
jgi:hypothetical protein